MNINRQTTVPVNVPRSRRNHPAALLTSFKAGVVAPLAVFPMFREDQFSGTFDIDLEMMEAKQFIMNPVKMRVTSYLVPWLAMARFEGSRDQFDRSYSKQPQVEGGDVVDFFETAAMGTHGANAIFKTMGLPAPSAQELNTMYVEGYNLIWNFRAKNRSKELTARLLNATSLAPAFWEHSRFAHILPDFDQSVIDGEVALNVVNSRLPVSGVGMPLAGSKASAGDFRDTTAPGGETWARFASSPTYLELDPTTDAVAVYAEMSEGGITVSLSNIELAKKTQAFARLREKYEGIDDEYIIDMLMNGITIPDQALKQPILLADQTVRISQAKRYATDAGNLAESAVSGGAHVSLNVRVPRLSVGGLVYILVECVPEQLFERQRDPFLYLDDPEDLPEFMRDFLDPEKVDVVLNGEIDVFHTSPSATFGYAPLNSKWNWSGPRVGGKFLKPASGSANDADRARLWGIETVDPGLTSDFYIVNAMHQKPFLDETGDPFELTLMGNAVIGGNTVFGGLLAEATGNYDAVLAEAPTERIQQS